MVVVENQSCDGDVVVVYVAGFYGFSIYWWFFGFFFFSDD